MSPDQRAVNRSVLLFLAHQAEPTTLADLQKATGHERELLTTALDDLDRVGAITVRHESFSDSGWVLDPIARAVLFSVGIKS